MVEPLSIIMRKLNGHSRTDPKQRILLLFQKVGQMQKIIVEPLSIIMRKLNGHSGTDPK
jgi:hypothetical protein